MPARIRDKLPAVPQEQQVREVAEDDRSVKLRRSSAAHKTPSRATPDNWIKRDTRLVRLTGKHPFNTEARLDELFNAGFLTPSNLFYVRNHGAVPRISRQDAEAWTLEVTGMVHRSQTFTLASLMDHFETVTLPVTLVCAGNRRKEQNVIGELKCLEAGER
jgi:DMSO/TMAO reductase YedYZ molybdopterin-dependent catalytic subunit